MPCDSLMIPVITLLTFVQEKQNDVESIRVSDELIVDMAPNGKIYGLELLNANEQLQHDDIGELVVINEATGEHIELPLSFDMTT